MAGAVALTLVGLAWLPLLVRSDGVHGWLSAPPKHEMRAEFDLRRLAMADLTRCCSS